MNGIEVIKQEIYDWAIKQNTVNSVNRQLQTNCIDLYNYDKITPISNVNFKSKTEFNCYSCNRKIKYSHNIYVYVCTKCGNRFQEYRNLTRDLSDNYLLVIGARTKLGHQIVIKLLESGATVIGTSRFPEKALLSYEKYPKWDLWKSKLHFYPSSFDLDTCDLENEFTKLKIWITSFTTVLTGLVFNAAQTIREKEKNQDMIKEAQNRYGDLKFVPDEMENSWGLTIPSISQKELEEVHRINAIAPFIAVKIFLPLLQNSNNVVPYIIHVHAREGIFDTHKSEFHIHTNMAKASLHMFTKCLKDCKYKTINNELIRIHGTNPAWFSVDEYYKDKCPWIVPPLDEVDGAARVLYPLFKELNSCGKTRNHFTNLTY